ncbi:hypothetical protein [Desulfotignum phosphitoxidans]|nr:hypothetical protein [Desulfotignum phosphitoxidans]
MKEKIKINFCNSLKIWVDSNFKGTQHELGKFFNVSQGYISNVLAGRRCGDETWRRFVAAKIGMDYDAMVGIEKGKSQNLSKKIVPIDPAVEFLKECIQEAEAEDYLNDKQKQALLQIIRDELKSAEKKAKQDIKKYLKVLRG